MGKLDVKLVACRGCGTPMVKLSRDICQKCYEAEEQMFQRVKDYLKTNPHSSLDETANSLNIPIEKIRFFIDSGRLERTGVHVSHQCQTCHKTIQTGLICPECADSIKKQVGDLKKNIDDRKEQRGDDLFKKKSDDSKGTHRGKTGA